MSPNTRSKILCGGSSGDEYTIMAGVGVDQSRTEESMMRTLVYDDAQDTMHDEEDLHSQRTSADSISSGLDERSSKSNSSKHHSEGKCAVDHLNVF